jgi:hypothetical protein
MTVMGQEIPESAEDEKKRKRREGEAAKKAGAEVEAIIDDARTVAGRVKLDAELFSVEAAGYVLVEDWRNPAEPPPALLAAKIEMKAAEERSAYVQRFEITTKEKAAWAAGKIAEARSHEEDVKAIYKAEVKRAERDHEGRKEFFESKLLAWALNEPKDRGTKGSIRLPSGGVRVEVRDAETGGVRIFDEKQLCEELIEKIGIAEASDLGIVELRPVLVVSKAKEFIEAHPGVLPLQHAVIEPRGEMKKLKIVRLQK